MYRKRERGEKQKLAQRERKEKEEGGRQDFF
jgi:hypothetical protein